MSVLANATGIVTISLGLLLFAAVIGSFVAGESSSVSISSSSSATNGEAPQTSTSVVTSGSGASGSASSSASVTDGNSTQVSVSQSTSAGSADAADAVVSRHLARLGIILDELEALGLDASVVSDARIKLAAQEQDWSSARTAEERTRVVTDLNAYWSDLRDKVHAAGITYDFDVELAVGQNGELTSASSGSGSAQSVAAIVTSTPAPVQIDATTQILSQPGQGASAQAQSQGVIEVAVNGVFGTIGAVVNAVARLFAGLF